MNGTKHARTEPPVEPCAECTSRPTRRELLRRALRRQCPHCGGGPIFRTFYTMHDACSGCGMNFDQSDGNTWFFMYFTSGGVIGVCFLILFFWRPQPANLPWVSALMISGALATLLLTLPFRKSLGMALDYLIEPPRDGDQC
ncbi:MAG: DUF983 domain-containing protein [Phycisphaerales bacterium]|nr:DUF983 domain-containing protein [Phycisphaerales bacterium]MCB9856045.1 DUF983 domain-containing protein [Phycisphaerales bacterium]MCB9863927.1 DUF983 domain-containing protein [Phycisphaerales bacterium]